MPVIPEWCSIKVLDGWTNRNREIKHIFEWKTGTIANHHTWAPWSHVFKAALEAFAIARGVEVESLESEYKSIIQSNGIVPFQHTHRDFLTDSYSIKENCTKMKAAEKKRKVAVAKKAAEEDYMEVEDLETETEPD